jgi:hypothetical protein
MLKGMEFIALETPPPEPERLNEFRHQSGGVVEQKRLDGSWVRV